MKTTTRKKATRKKATGRARAKRAKARKPKATPQAKAEPKWQHPNRIRCPRCNSSMTKTTGTRDDGRIKRWECKHPVCRHRWETRGKPL